MEKRTENAIVNAIGELGVKLDNIEKAVVNLDKRIVHLDMRVETLDKRFETLDKRFETMDMRFEKLDLRLVSVEKNTGDLNHKFERMFDLLKGNLDLLPRIVRLEGAVFKQ